LRAGITDVDGTWLNRLTPALVIGCLVPALLGPVARAAPSFVTFVEAPARDVYCAGTRVTPALGTVAVVGLDDRTLAHFEWRARLNLRNHARLVRQLQRFGVRSVAFDFSFVQSEEKDPVQYDEFAAACRDYGKVVLGVIPAEGSQSGFQKPLPKLVEAAAALGVLCHPLDTDSVIRRATLRFPSADGVYNALSLQAYLTAEDLPGTALADRSNAMDLTYGTDRMSVPLDNGNMLIWYAGPDGTIPTYSYLDVLEGTVPDGALRDRVVFVGPTAKILQDLRLVPAFSHGDDRASTMTGVEIHANTFLTLNEGFNLGGRFLHEPSTATAACLLAGCSLATAIPCALLELYLSWLVPLVLVAGYLALSNHYLHLQLRLLPPLAGPVTAIVLTYLALVIYRYLDERNRRRRVRSMFEHFVPSHVVERLERDPSLLQAPGRERELTVLFSDIRGFTPLSERLGAERTVRLLNRYFEAMTAVILEHEGMIDKFIGDAILAVFGEPVSSGDHTRQAVRAALDMRRALERLNADPEFRSLLDRDEGLDTGIAINTGPMFVGNLGGLKRKDYTVIGDAVNLCSRLEGLARDENPRIIVSEAAYSHVQDMVEVRSLGDITVKGKSVPVSVFGILGARRTEEAAE